MVRRVAPSKLTAEDFKSGAYIPLTPFQPIEWQIAPWKDKSFIVLLTGSSGGGKSRIACEKVHAFAMHYANSMCVIARKTMTAHLNTSLLFMQSSVIGPDPRVHWKRDGSRFEYDNGSVVAFVGFDSEESRKKIRSIGKRGGLDFVWVEEATELQESDFNIILSRMRGNAAGWRQIMLTTNPETPLHWIYRRLIVGGEAKVYYSKALDNPYNPKEYINTLQQMTGLDKLRLAEGLWIQASGVVYDVWKDGEGGNVTEEAEFIRDGGEVYWAVDDGYAGEMDKHTGYYTAGSHPRAFLLCQMRPDGTLCVFNENYAVQRLSEDHISEVVKMQHSDGQPYPIPDYVAVDKSAAELIGRFSELGYYTRRSMGGAPTSVEESIKEVRRWVAADKNGKRRLLVHPRCKHFRAEMSTYARSSETGKPLKMFDHGCDSIRYICWGLRHTDMEN